MDEWHGAAHLLTVQQVDGELEIEIDHPWSCEQVTEKFYGVTVARFNCDVEWIATDCGLLESLDYSGQKITDAGLYLIRAWGCKYYVWDAGAYEYDAGLQVIATAGISDQRHPAGPGRLAALE
jgi:hypothetical protein